MTSSAPTKSATPAAGVAIVESRARAYDRHYRTDWHARTFTREEIEVSLSDFATLESGGHPNGNEIQSALRFIGVPDVHGRVVLDYCCGTGVTAIYFAMLGARVLAFDRSPAAVAIARESARRSGVLDRIVFVVGDARRLPCTPGRFDAAFCQSALHIILDYPECAEQLAGAIRPGGRAVFCEEALRYNRVFEMIRRLRRRRFAECGGRAIDYEDIHAFGAPFSQTGIDHFNFFFQAKTLFGHPIRGRALRRLLRGLDALDRRLLGRFPGLVRFCGKVVVRYVR